MSDGGKMTLGRSLIIRDITYYMQVASETPDIVSSCDSGEGSKRNSLELDTESLGILRLASNKTY